MPKTDFAREHKAYYTAKKRPELIHIAPALFLSLCGKGDPSGPSFAADLQALYSMAYAIKFHYKALGADFVVPKLEGLWWYDEQRYPGLDSSAAPQQVARGDWEYRLLLRMPPQLRADELELLREETITRKALPGLESVTLFRMDEGRCVQILHTGPFDREPESLALLQTYMDDYGFRRNGLHHEIYLSDFRKTPPEKLRTILREPVQ